MYTFHKNTVKQKSATDTYVRQGVSAVGKLASGLVSVYDMKVL
jgi:hypothetical protein